MNWINPFHATGLFLVSFWSTGNQRFPDVFRGYKNRPVTPETRGSGKETLAQVFFIEFCEISKNTLSYRVNSRSPVFLFSIFISIIENVLPGEISNNWKFFIFLVITWPWVAMPGWNFNLFSQDRFQPKITWGNQISFRQSGTFFRLVFV